MILLCLTMISGSPARTYRLCRAPYLMSHHERRGGDNTHAPRVMGSSHQGPAVWRAPAPCSPSGRHRGPTPAWRAASPGFPDPSALGESQATKGQTRSSLSISVSPEWRGQGLDSERPLHLRPMRLSAGAIPASGAAQKSLEQSANPITLGLSGCFRDK